MIGGFSGTRCWLTWFIFLLYKHTTVSKLLSRFLLCCSRFRGIIRTILFIQNPFFNITASLILPPLFSPSKSAHKSPIDTINLPTDERTSIRQQKYHKLRHLLRVSSPGERARLVLAEEFGGAFADFNLPNHGCGDDASMIQGRENVREPVPQQGKQYLTVPLSRSPPQPEGENRGKDMDLFRLTAQ